MWGSAVPGCMVGHYAPSASPTAHPGTIHMILQASLVPIIIPQVNIPLHWIDLDGYPVLSLAANHWQMMSLEPTGFSVQLSFSNPLVKLLVVLSHLLHLSRCGSYRNRSHRNWVTSGPLLRSVRASVCCVLVSGH